MAKQAFGGDDDVEYEDEKEEKPKLQKFHLSPDKNLRDIFWAIMAEYATTKQFKNAKEMEDDRYAFMNIALSILSTEDERKYGLSFGLLIRYVLQFSLDGEWMDVFAELLSNIMYRAKLQKKGINGVKYLFKKSEYKDRIIQYLKEMLKVRKYVNTALFVLSRTKEKELINPLKNELIMFAKAGGVEEQLLAMDALSNLIDEDEDVKNLFKLLLTSWNEDIRAKAAKYLGKKGGSVDVKKSLSLRKFKEESRKVLEVLKRIEERRKSKKKKDG